MQGPWLDYLPSGITGPPATDPNDPRLAPGDRPFIPIQDGKVGDIISNSDAGPWNSYAVQPASANDDGPWNSYAASTAPLDPHPADAYQVQPSTPTGNAFPTQQAGGPNWGGEANRAAATNPPPAPIQTPEPDLSAADDPNLASSLGTIGTGISNELTQEGQGLSVAARRFAQQPIGTLDQAADVSNPPQEDPTVAPKMLAGAAGGMAGMVASGGAMAMPYAKAGLQATVGALTGNIPMVIGSADTLSKIQIGDVKDLGADAGQRMDDVMNKVVPGLTQDPMYQFGQDVSGLGIPEGIQAVESRVREDMGDTAADYFSVFSSVGMLAFMGKGAFEAKDVFGMPREQFNSLPPELQQQWKTTMKTLSSDPQAAANAFASQVLDFRDSIGHLISPITNDEFSLSDDETPTSRVRRIIDSGKANATDLLTAIQEHPDASPVERAGAEYLLSLAQMVGMDQTKVKRGFNTTAELPPAPEAEAFPSASGIDVTELPDVGTKKRGSYNPTTDTISIYDPDRYGTALHEVWHSVLSAAVDKYEQAKADPTLQAGFNDQDKLMYGRMDGVSKVYEAAKANYEAKLKNDPAYDKDNQAQHAKDFSNLQEFTATALTRDSMIGELKRQRVSNELLAENKTQGSRPFYNRYLQLKQAFINLVHGDAAKSAGWGGPSMLDLAMDHLTGAAEAQTAELRMSRRMNEGRAAGKSIDAANVERMQDLSKYIQQMGHWDTMSKVAGLLRDAGSQGEFEARLSLINPHPAWENMVHTMAPDMWAHKDTIVRAVGTNFDFRKLDPVTQAIIGDPRGHQEFFQQFREDNQISDQTGINLDQLKKGLQAQRDTGKDISMDIDRGGMYLQAPDQFRLLKAGDSIAGQILNWYLSKNYEYRALKAQIFAKAMELNQPYQNLKHSEKIAAMKEVAYWNDPLQGKAVLLGHDLQWPSKQMILNRGVAENVADAYLGRAAAHDYALARSNEAVLKNGGQPLKPSPGYMPSEWDRPFKVFVKEVEYDKKTGAQVGERTVLVKDFSWKGIGIGNSRIGGAMAYIKSVQDKPVRSINPQTGNPTVQMIENRGKEGLPYSVNYYVAPKQTPLGAIRDSLVADKNFSDLDPVTKQQTYQAQADFLRGANRHLFEREDVSGFIGEHGPKQNLLDVIGASPSTNRILRLDEGYFRQMSDHYGNTMFMSEVYRPSIEDMIPHTLDYQELNGNLMDNMTNLADYVEEFTSNWTGKNINNLNFLDRDWNYEPHNLLGLSPNLVKDALTWTKNSFSLFKLRGNPGFYLGNVMQQTYVMSMLDLSNSLLSKAGREVQSPWVTAAHMVKELPELSPEMQDAEQWAKDNHILESSYERMLRNAPTPGSHLETSADVFHYMTGGKINPYIENWSRTNSFLFAYKHFRLQDMSADQARTAAGGVMRMTMTDFMKESRPLAFQNFGLLGNAISPFQVYRNAQLGNMYMIARGLLRSPASAAAWKPLVSTMLTYMALAGVQGLPLVAEWTAIANTWNALVPEHRFPTPFDLIHSQTAHNPFNMLTPNARRSAEFGLLSMAPAAIPYFSHGSYFGSSMGSVSITDGIQTALVGWVQTAAEVLGLSAKLIGSYMGILDPVTRADIKDVGSQFIPGVLQPAFNAALRPSGTNVKTGSTMEGGYESEPSDSHAEWILGRKSVVETENTKMIQNTETILKGQMKRAEGLINGMVDVRVQNNPGGTDTATARNILTNELGWTDHDIQDAIQAKVDGELHSYVTKTFQEKGRKGLIHQQMLIDQGMAPGQ